MVLVKLVILFIVLYYLFPLVQVVGNSMHPTYKDTEIIMGTRLYFKSRLKKGDVIVYHSPDGRIVIKRIFKVMKDKVVLNKTLFNRVETYYYCVGDNSEYSHDSRNYGYIDSKKLVCKVINQRRNMNDVCNQEGRNT